MVYYFQLCFPPIFLLPSLYASNPSLFTFSCLSFHSLFILLFLPFFFYPLAIAFCASLFPPHPLRFCAYFYHTRPEVLALMPKLHKLISHYTFAQYFYPSARGGPNHTKVKVNPLYSLCTYIFIPTSFLFVLLKKTFSLLNH